MFRCLVADDDFNRLDGAFRLTIGLRMEGSTVVLFRAHAGKKTSPEGAYKATVAVRHKGDRNTPVVCLKIVNGRFAPLFSSPFGTARNEAIALTELVDANEQLVERLVLIFDRWESHDEVHSNSMERDRRNDNRLETAKRFMMLDLVLQASRAVRNVFAQHLAALVQRDAVERLKTTVDALMTTFVVYRRKKLAKQRHIARKVEPQVLGKVRPLRMVLNHVEKAFMLLVRQYGPVVGPQDLENGTRTVIALVCVANAPLKVVRQFNSRTSEREISGNEGVKIGNVGRAGTGRQSGQGVGDDVRAARPVEDAQAELLHVFGCTNEAQIQALDRGGRM